jgi:hypothetical protein
LRIVFLEEPSSSNAQLCRPFVAAVGRDIGMVIISGTVLDLSPVQRLLLLHRRCIASVVDTASRRAS